ncbi:MAG: carboxypeptidase regulatory-like domain-containing protein, partial [Acidobacteria bacterium]|nr:carboxypeptidase regulatory-like domain-containing protein [Acidobacteriota bacterium]
MRKRRIVQALAALVLLFPLSWMPASAQITTGGITGKIVDEKGDPLPGVLVTARNRDTGIERAVTTDGSGNFSLLALPPATYIVQATFTGYGAPLKTVVVNLGQKVP